MSQSHPTGPWVWIGLIFWLAVTFTVAWIGSWFQPGEWYAGLVKPTLTPPGWIFGPVWTLLYAMMATAAWLVWRRYGWANAIGPLGLFFGQLALNALWSYLFFGAHHLLLAFIEVMVLWIVIVLTMVSFWRTVPAAGALLIPYVIWVGYASVLNFQLWRLNG